MPRSPSPALVVSSGMTLLGWLRGVRRDCCELSSDRDLQDLTEVESVEKDHVGAFANCNLSKALCAQYPASCEERRNT